MKFPEQEIHMPTLIETPEQLGDVVRHTRKALSLTQPQLALAAGVGVRITVDLEAGKPTVRLENVLRVLQALGATLTCRVQKTARQRLARNEPRPRGLAAGATRRTACTSRWSAEFLLLNAMAAIRQRTSTVASPALAGRGF